MDWLKNIFNWPVGIILILTIVISVYLFFYLYKPTIKNYTYKTTPQGKLEIKIYLPKEHSANDRRPAILFFFGGGWISGNKEQFRKQADYLSKRGMVAALVDYRIDSKHHTTPNNAVEDGLDAINWMANHADMLGINTNKIIASGGSAGGHIAACLALCNIKQSASIRPSLLILYNPVLDLMNAAPELEFSSRELELIEAIGPDMAKSISPNQHINQNTPDTLMIFGDNDPLLQQANDFILAAKKFDIEVQLLVAQNNGHGFFNKEPWLSSSIRAMDQYLVNKGYLQGAPLITSATVKSASLKPH